MGKSTSEISQELDQTRADASEKIEKIEQQVTQSAESVKQSLDWRHQVDTHPLMARGVAFAGGVVLGGMSGGSDGHARQETAYHPVSSANGSTGNQPGGGGISGAIKQAARSSGADEAFSSAAAAMLSTAEQRLKQAVDETYPGFSERYENAKSASGGVTERMKAAQESEDATASATEMRM